VSPGKRHIDLNADLGEGEATDDALLEIVSSCNVACGGHAGDPASMRATIRAAAARDVAVGAHPSYPDRRGFGRRSGFMDAARLEPAFERQLTDLLDVAAEVSIRIGHVKPHGALYNDAARSRSLADTIARAVAALDKDLTLVGPPSSELERAAARAGLDYIAEGFVDRAYMADGSLRPRGEPGAVYAEPERAARQAAEIAVHRRVTTAGGEIVPLDVATLCIHGDTPGAVASAEAVRYALEEAGVRIAAPARG
jgi:UPF0271 protein